MNEEFSSKYSIRKIIKNTSKAILSNKMSYVNTAVILQFFNSSIAIWIINILFNIARDIVGLNNIDIKNYTVFLKNPLSLILFVAIFCVIALSTYIDFSFLTLNAYSHQENLNIGIVDIIKNAFNKFKSLLNLQLFFIIIYFILMIPLANLGLNSIITKKLYIPNFIKLELLKSPISAIIYSSLIILFLYLNIKTIFVLPLMLTSSKNVSKSIKTSLKLTNLNFIKPIIATIIMQIIVTITYIGIIYGLYLGIIFIESFAGKFDIVLSGFMIGFFGIITLFYISIGKIIITHVLVFILSKNDLIDFKYIKREKNTKKIQKRIIILFYTISSITFGIFISGFLYFYEYDENYTSIIAHRGYTKRAVENSIEALKEASKFKANYVEMDILQTRDKKYVVVHDNNLKRLSGFDIEVSSSNFSEVHNLPISKGEFASSISSLDEYIEAAKKLNIKLLIEIKLHGSESDDYIDIFYKILKKHNVEKKYIVQSIDLNTVNMISKKYPDIKIGYIVPLSFGFNEDINADFLAVEEFSYRDELVEYARIYNMPVYIWTINTFEGLQKRIFERVDGIITDELEMVQTIKKNLKDSTKISERLLYLINYML